MFYSTSSLKRILFIVILLAGCFFASTAQAEVLDTDGDGLADDREAIYYTDPYNSDTDRDGYLDGLEVEKGFSPHAANGLRMHQFDYDKDGLNDWLERWFQSDIGKSDTDADTLSDFEEVMKGGSPLFEAEGKKFHQQIVVDRTVQRLHYFVDGMNIVTVPVSTGNPKTPTPAGEFQILRKVPLKRYVGADYDLPNVTWNMEFIPLYYIHTAYWHNDFGKRTHSHGCVNLREADADLLYKYIDVGVPVTVTGTTPARFRVGT